MPDFTDPCHEVALQWIRKEHAGHQGKKFTQEQDDKMTLENAEEWEGQILNYFHRAMVLGITSPGGRQAAGKMAATAVAFLESVLRVYGDLPAPGVPSGHLYDPSWKVKA